VTRILRSVDPATGDEVASYPTFTTTETEAAVAAADQAQRAWRGTSLDERARRLAEAARLLRERREPYATLITREMGKPIAEARAEIDKCARTCRFYAENGAAFLAPESVETAAHDSFTTYEPLGVVLAIMPWNFPFWQVTRFAAPALMAGNGGLLKHAPNVSGCALAFEAMLADARIAAVTITGSDRAGAHVAAAAGRALKKSVLELGGSDPFLVLADADLPAVAVQAARSRFLTGGRRIGDRGCFYAPTVLTDVRPGMPAYDEETFGPVAAVIRVADEEHAIGVANDTAYGLGASVWTGDVERGLRVARQVQSGAVFVNAMVASDPGLPVGGIKRSGYGRELSAAGIRGFTNPRTYWVSGSAAPDPGAP
jgi:succinate-semialdehyde dehydrogenase / glutarate-semialdehyde dehydrogenase